MLARDMHSIGERTNQGREGKMEARSGYGYCIPGLTLEMLLLYGMPFEKASHICDILNAEIAKANWLSTYEGVQFDKGFDPREGKTS